MCHTRNQLTGPLRLPFLKQPLKWCWCRAWAGMAHGSPTEAARALSSNRGLEGTYCSDQLHMMWTLELVGRFPEFILVGNFVYVSLLLIPRKNRISQYKTQSAAMSGGMNATESSFVLCCEILDFFLICFYINKAIGVLPLTKCHFSYSIFWLHGILVEMRGGGLKKGGNAPRATESQRCKSSASYQHHLLHHIPCCFLSWDNNTAKQLYNSTKIQQYINTTIHKDNNMTKQQYNNTIIWQYINTTMHEDNNTTKQQYNITTIRNNT